MLQHMSLKPNLGESEIGQLENPLPLVRFTVQEILRLEVPVYYPLLMAIQDGVYHLLDADPGLVLCVMILEAPVVTMQRYDGCGSQGSHDWISCHVWRCRGQTTR